MTSFWPHAGSFS